MYRRQMGNNPKRVPRHRYLESNKRHNEKHITVREESLYKPFLTVILILTFILVIIFPISIFDNMFPEVMSFLRRLFGWMSLSAVATLLVLPVSVFDLELIRIFSDFNQYDTGFVIFAIGFAVLSDTFFAFIGYRFTKQLTKLFLRKVKKRDFEKSNANIRKYGNIGMFFFSCTPLPFTLAIYTAGAVRLNLKGFLIAVASGRLVKYTAFALFLRLFGINLVELGQNLFTTIFG
ncbi:MAG: VTT domain-containing protein [Firmicutes bacterium]|nr:VTT domain-containing protein [Bacillota bacterium]